MLLPYVLLRVHAGPVGHLKEDEEMEATKQKKAVSPAKLAANRANAQHSTGPKTEEGKRKSAYNAWRDGSFAKCLFRTREQQDREGKDFALILDGVRDHYRPVGFWEDFWAEKVAVEAFRLARALAYEQEVLDSALAFEMQSIDKILRCQAAAKPNLRGSDCGGNGRQGTQGRDVGDQRTHRPRGGSRFGAVREA